MRETQRRRSERSSAKRNTVYSLLNRGRKLLRKELGGDEGEE